MLAAVWERTFTRNFSVYVLFRPGKEFEVEKGNLFLEVGRGIKI